MLLCHCILLKQGLGAEFFVILLINLWNSAGQLMALIGEQFDEADEICGVVASVRQRQDKISLWTKTATNEAAQVLVLQFYLLFIFSYYTRF